VCLAVAVWALLFGPGALADQRLGDATVDLGAAVAAPTVEHGAFVGQQEGKVARTDETIPGDLPTVQEAVDGCVAAAPEAHRHTATTRSSLAAEPALPCTRRGPPAST
jgi:hypothetical protein